MPDPTEPTTDASGVARLAGLATRRTLLRGAVLAGVAAPILAACGSGDDDKSSADSASTPSGDSDSSSTPPDAGSGESSSSGAGSNAADAIAKTTEVPEGGGIILDDPGIVITQPAAGEFKGFSNICKHAGCPLSSVSDGKINCDCHGSQYSIEDGSPVTGPSGQPASSISALDVKEITVAGKDISLA